MKVKGQELGLRLWNSAVHLTDVRSFVPLVKDRV